VDQPDPVRQIADLFLFAPLGLVTQARSKVPELATAGRNQVALYNMIGKFAVAHGKTVVSKWADQQRAHAKTRSTGVHSDATAAPALVNGEQRTDTAGVTAMDAQSDTAPTELAGAERTSTRRTSTERTRSTGSSTGRSRTKSLSDKPAQSGASRQSLNRTATSRTASSRTATGGASKKSTSPQTTRDARRPSLAGQASPSRSSAVDAPLRVPPVVGVGALAIADYDDLAASQIVGLLGTLSASERDDVALYESTHRRRSTVLGKIDRLRSGQ
jgi:cobalamin biosynthesis Mg chelatase CobN